MPAKARVRMAVPSSSAAMGGPLAAVVAALRPNAAALLVALLAVLAVLIRFVLSWMAGMDHDCWHGITGAFMADPKGGPTPVPPGFKGLEPSTAAPGKPPPEVSVFDPPSKSLSVVMPAYNEVDRLASTLEETIAYLKARTKREGGASKFSWEIIVVDDGSRDGTAAVAAGFVKREGFEAVRVLRLGLNRGKGYAVKRGALVARGRWVLFADADAATRISDVERLEQQLTAALAAAAPTAAGASGAPADRSAQPGLAVGSRAHLQAQAVAQRSWYRNLAMHIFHWSVWLATQAPVQDSQCGFKLMTRPAARLIYANQRLRRWGFDVELIYLAKWLQMPIVEVEVNWTEVPGSKLRFSSLVHIFIELAAVPTAYVSGLWQVQLAPQGMAAAAGSARR